MRRTRKKKQRHGSTRPRAETIEVTETRGFRYFAADALLAEITDACAYLFPSRPHIAKAKRVQLDTGSEKCPVRYFESLQMQCNI